MEIESFQPGPPPFGYRQAGLTTWEEVPEEQMIVNYIIDSHAAGVSLRKIAHSVESVYGKKLTHAGVDKIIKRRSQTKNLAEIEIPVLRSRPHEPMSTFKKGIKREETFSSRQQSPLQPLTLELDDVFFSVRNLLEAAKMELGLEQVETMLLRIKLGTQRITENIHNWDDSLLKTIEGSYQHALARQAYLLEQKQKTEPVKEAGFKPGDVVELAEGVWYQCEDCNRRFTKDPKAAGWAKSYGDVWDCAECAAYHRSYASVRGSKKEISFEIGDDEGYKCKFTFAQVKALIKELGKDKQGNKLELQMWNHYVKKMDQPYGFIGGNLDDKYFEIVKRLTGFDKAVLPAIPETIKL